MAVMMGTVLVVMGSCGHARVVTAQAQEKAEEYAAEVVIERGDDSRLPRPQRPRIVPRGGKARFVDDVGTSYILVPSPEIRKIVDGRELAAEDGFVAIRVEPGRPGVLKIPEDYPGRERTVVLQYAILACEGTGEDRGCEYVEGGSPPWIIIPPSEP